MLYLDDNQLWCGWLKSTKFDVWEEEVNVLNSSELEVLVEKEGWWINDGGEVVNSHLYIYI